MLLSCKKEDASSKANAVVIAFHAEKCMCCWGWDVKIGNDTIRIDDPIMADSVGFEIKSPIPVLIELGKKEEPCSSYPIGIDFYEVISIEEVN